VSQFTDIRDDISHPIFLGMQAGFLLDDYCPSCARAIREGTGMSSTSMKERTRLATVARRATIPVRDVGARSTECGGFGSLA
jgi:hypothetical protein